MHDVEEFPEIRDSELQEFKQKSQDEVDIIKKVDLEDYVWIVIKKTKIIS